MPTALKGKGKTRSHKPDSLSKNLSPNQQTKNWSLTSINRNVTLVQELN